MLPAFPVASSFVTPTLRLLLLYALFFFTQCQSAEKAFPDLTQVPVAEHPKNIILLIGDGMALPQASAGVYWSGGLSSSVFSLFPYVGFHKSHAHDDLITDSAAGATAFACGKKTFNGAIGMTPDRTACRSILEEWEGAGKATGIVVTCTATHATPASFIAHEEMRAFTESIALEYLTTPVDCFVGGGAYYFSPERPDGLNLKDTLRQRGYVIREGTTFKKLPMDGTAPFMLLTHEKEPPTASAGRSYLPVAVREVTQYLSKRSDKGFFLLVEGSQIDWALHANDRHWLRAEMLDFDKAVREALRFAASDGQTLVIVTGDHECGGLSLNDSDTKRTFKPVFGSRYHTGTLVPVYAFGPQAATFQGIYENTALHDKMKAAMPAE